MLEFHLKQSSSHQRASQSASRRDGITSGLRPNAKRAQCFVKNTTSCAVRLPSWIGRSTCGNGMTSKGPTPTSARRARLHTVQYLSYEVGLVTIVRVASSVQFYIHI
jgi:hypothetical protein